MYLNVMPSNHLIRSFLLCLLVQIGFAETPAHQILTYSFSNRSAGMGGTRAADPSGMIDVNGNPASHTFIRSLQGQVGFVNHLVGIQGYSATGVLPLERHRLSVELIYFDYGLFERTDIYGNTGSTFGYHELASSLGYAFLFTEKLRLGSRLGRYLRVADGNSSADLFYDVGAIYHDHDDSLTVGLYLAAVPLGDPRETFPTQLRLGSSKILSHLPLRLNLEGIYNWNEVFQLALGGELLIHPQFSVRVGVTSNRFDLQTGVTESDFVAGVTAGFALDWQGMLVEMAGQSFGAAGWINQISISYRL